MSERETISEESTVRDDSIGGLPKGWTRDDTSPSLTSELEQLNSLIEQRVQARISDVIKERDNLKEELKKEREEKDSVLEENRKLKKATINLTLKNQELQDKYDEAQRTINALRGESVCVPGCEDYDFVYDATNFGLADPDVIDSFFLKLQGLAQKKDLVGNFLMDCSAAIIPIFIVLSKDERINKKYRYIGGLESFCNEWNYNVVAKISDESRRQELTCDYDCIKTMINRAPFKESNPVMWQRKLNEGKNVKVLARALNLKVQMEKLFA